MKLVLLAGSAHVPLARAIASQAGASLAKRDIERFPDGELRVEVGESVRGADVFILQPTGPSVADNLLELLLLADACRRSGSRRLTAVISYFGYARQDRRSKGREPIGARLVSDLLATAGFQRIVAVDLHDPALEGFPSIPVEHLSALGILADAARSVVPKDAIVVGPDLGATKLAEAFASKLDRPVAIVHKARVSGESVRVHRVIGDVAGKLPVIVDDMISTGGTVVAAAEALYRAGCQGPLTVIATHALLVGPAWERLERLPIKELIVTDTLATPRREESGLPLRIVSVSKLLAEAVSRLHRDESLGDLLAHHG